MKKQITMSEEEFKSTMGLAKIETEHFLKTEIPRCSKCKKKMVKGIDSKTKKVSKYLWKYDCKCNPNNLGLITANYQ